MNCFGVKEILLLYFIKEFMDSTDDPPDRYQCLKIPIEHIICDDCDYDVIFNTINDAVIRSNKITAKAYLLLRLWILEKYHNKIDLPLITIDTIKMAIMAVKIPSTGDNKLNNDNLLLLQEFRRLYSFPSLENGKNLAQILLYYAKTMLTAIENNIKFHFMDYINRFVNSYFKNLYIEEIKNKDFKDQLFKELKVLKNDIKNGSKDCNEKYYKWLDQYRFQIVPREYDVSYYYDIKVNPQKYLKHMIFMNIELEKFNGKMFQFFPLQTNLVHKHIQIDTTTLIDLFVKKNKKPYIANVGLYKEFLWNEIFNIKQSIKEQTKGSTEEPTKKPMKRNTQIPIKRLTQHLSNDYIFDHTIITDGYTVSLRFVQKDHAIVIKEREEKKSIGRAAVKGLTKEEKKIIRDIKRKELAKKNKEKKKNIAPLPKKIEVAEFPYIDDVDKNELNGKHIFIDPGKRSLLTMMDDDGKFVSYTNRERLTRTKRLKYQKLIQNYKNKKDINIAEIEKTLTSFNSKTCDVNKFRDYMAKKISVNEELYPKYENTIFRQYKWYGHINKKRADNQMLRKIEKEYSKDHIIIMGDWSITKQMKHFISTPNISIKRKLNERFKVYDIDEYRTSCLHHKTEDRCGNLYLPDDKNVARKKHSILTYKMLNNRQGCINRDRNGCKNIKKLFDYYMSTGLRPARYKRGTKIA
jgi:hypothetical protein